MKRILVGCVLLAICGAGGAVAFGQSSDAPNPLAARIAELESAYQATVSQIVQLEAELDRLREQKTLIEGGVSELRRYQEQIATPLVMAPEPAEPPSGEDE